MISLSNEKILKINVGCGNRKIHGYINVDVREDVHPDLVCDVSRISEVLKNADLIYACHVLEHFPEKPFPYCRTTCYDVLNDWYKTLKSGGTIRLSVPDLQAVCQRYSVTGDLAEVKALLFGGQKYDYDYHFFGWDFFTLKAALEKSGFSNVRTYDWKSVEHHYIDDYSQAYLPHMDKINGRLMSLNVEATKL